MNTPKNIAALRERDGWRCMLCNEPFDDPPPSSPDPMSVQVDHIVEFRKDGADALDNLRLAHARCNNSRQDEERSPRQLARDEKARARWAAVAGKEKANEIEAAIFSGDPLRRAAAVRTMLAARDAKKSR